MFLTLPNLQAPDSPPTFPGGAWSRVRRADTDPETSNNQAREKKRKYPENTAPLRSVNGQVVLAAHRAQKVARAKIDLHETQLAVDGHQRMTRHAAARLRSGDVAREATGSTKNDRWEKDALKVMFGIDVDSSDNREDSDYEDKAAIPSEEGSEGLSKEDESGSDSKPDVEGGGSSQESGSSAESSTSEVASSSQELPNLHRISPNVYRNYDLRVRQAVPSWFHGFKSTFKSWELFHEAFDAFQEETYQRFTKRTTTSVAARNKQILSLSKARKHAGKKPGKSQWCVVLTRERHNYGLNKHTFDDYAEIRTVKDSKLGQDVAVLHKAGASALGILRYLREQTGKKTKLRDVHNMVQRYKVAEHAGLTDTQRAFTVLDEFARQNDGNSAQVLVDPESKVARIATFQTARMKRLFKAFPEVVMVDSTHNTNVNRYKLFSFVVHDVFGEVPL
ncbi:hypothetical protein L917_21627 [Phytophthora nicotianae]|uniref:ZSWIM1/3 RNaseH-like domain-containing protein n=1 Tax=Phytophthora nicotianae TaxID=4792 RepID=W2JYP5_PHYNI|nr:hypothetical protein L917_21627 [Phytophthora nicotianae]